MRPILLSALLVALPLYGLAEDTAIDEIAVTATPRPASYRDISAALSRVADDALDANSLTTDALRGSVGVTVQRTTPGQGAAIIRGLKGSSVLHLVDGMRLNNAIFRSAPTQYLALVPATAIDHIEIIRGAPAGLYGSDAVGGVVHVIPHRPRFDAAETEVHGNVRISFDSAELGKSAGATVDVGNERLAGSISAEYLATGNRRTGDGRLPTGGYTSKAARLFLAATPSDTESWSIDLHWLEQPETPRVDELIPGFGQSEPSSSEFFFAPNRRLFVHAEHSKKDGLFGLDWDIDLAWQRIVDDRRTRDFEATVRTLEKNRSDLVGASVETSDLAGKTSWTVGAEAYHDTVSSERDELDLLAGLARPVASRFPDDAEVRQLAVFGGFSRPVAESHKLSGSLRFNAVDIELPASAALGGTSIDTRRWSGNLGWIYDASAAWQVAANLGFGFRAPNVFDLGTLGNRPGNRFNVPSSRLGPESVVHGDLGLRYRSERARFELVVFALDYEDRITSILTGEVTADGRDIVQSANAASATIEGVEIGIELELSQGVSMAAAAAYTRGEQRLSGDSHEPGDRIPPLNGRLGISVDGARDWTFEGWLDWSGAQDRLSARDVRDIRIDPAGTPGWATIGARAMWDGPGDWQLTLSLSNLLDKRYRVHGSGLDEPGTNLAVVLRRDW